MFYFNYMYVYIFLPGIISTLSTDYSRDTWRFLKNKNDIGWPTATTIHQNIASEAYIMRNKFYKMKITNIFKVLF